MYWQVGKRLGAGFILLLSLVLLGAADILADGQPRTNRNDPSQNPLPPTPAVAAGVFRYRADYRLKVSDLPADAKKVQVWFWVPLDLPEQRILDLEITDKPEKCKFVSDNAGNRYLAAEVDDPKGMDITLAMRADIERREIRVKLPRGKIQFSASHKLLFEEHLDTSRKSGFHISRLVTKWAEENIKEENDPVETMRQIYDWVVSNTMHYTNPDARGKISSSVADSAVTPGRKVTIVVDEENGKIEEREAQPNLVSETGNAGNPVCALVQKGGGCTDQHSLIIAGARLRGIPARIQFGSRLAYPEGEEKDPGYRCSVEYFMPGFGWVPLDAMHGGTGGAGKSEAVKKKYRDYYFSNKDSKWFTCYRGRNLPLTTFEGGSTQPVNLFLHAYVLVDGKPHLKWKPTLKYGKLP